MAIVSDYTAIISGYSWNGDDVFGRPKIITYSFLDAPSDGDRQVYPASGLATFRKFSVQEQAVARETLDAWARISGIVFIETGGAHADVTFNFYNFDAIGRSDASGLGYYPFGTDNLLYGATDNSGNTTYADDIVNSPLFFRHVLLHEIGHAIGLKHSFDRGDAPYDNQLRSDLDNISNTVMSYSGNLTGTLGRLDIDAVRVLYGDGTIDGSTFAWSWDASAQVITQTGTGASDTISGTGGNDRIIGGAGNDTIATSWGSDTIDGGSGNDTLYGGYGDDTVYGDTGNDRIYDYDGRNALFGGDGNDEIDAGSGRLANTLDGGFGDDRITGGAGNDTISGGPGTDTIFAGLGSDIIIFNAGDGSDVVSNFSASGADIDVIRLIGFGISSFTDLIRSIQVTGNNFVITLGADRISGYFEAAERFSAMNFTFGGTGRTIFGTAAAETLEGTGLDDIIVASGGNDWVYSRAGDDRVNGGDGDDVLIGGDGNDELGGGAGADVILGEAGNDTIFGEAGRNRMNGGDGNDILVGGADIDELGGGTGDDILIGSDGDDTVFGEAGNDRLSGGAGADILVGGSGNDELGGDDGDDVIIAEDGADTLFGGSGSDRLNAGGGDDVVIAGAGADEVGGGFGNDFLAGNEGSDTLFGEAGNDTLDGGADDDVLLGGSGSDQFNFGPASGRDIIVDFNFNEGDRIATFGQQFNLAFDMYGNVVLNLSGGGSVVLSGVQSYNPGYMA